jgi:hypothetical protein
MATLLDYFILKVRRTGLVNYERCTQWSDRGQLTERR